MCHRQGKNGHNFFMSNSAVRHHFSGTLPAHPQYRRGIRDLAEDGRCDDPGAGGSTR